MTKKLVKSAVKGSKKVIVAGPLGPKPMYEVEADVERIVIIRQIIVSGNQPRAVFHAAKDFGGPLLDSLCSRALRIPRHDIVPYADERHVNCSFCVRALAELKTRKAAEQRKEAN